MTAARARKSLRASLAETGVTPQHSLDLLVAFRRDATKLRYADWDELLDYCRYSAMPVGRHVLDLHGESRDTWAAVRRAVRRVAGAEPSAGLRRRISPTLDRCYLPRDLMAAHGIGMEDVCAARRQRRACGVCSTRCWTAATR